MKNTEEILLNLNRLLRFEINRCEEDKKELIRREQKIEKLQAKKVVLNENRKYTLIQEQESANVQRKELYNFVYNEFSILLNRANDILVNCSKISLKQQKEIKNIGSEILYLNRTIPKNVSHPVEWQLFNESWSITEVLLNRKNADFSYPMPSTTIEISKNQIVEETVRDINLKEKDFAEQGTVTLTMIHLINFMWSQGQRSVSINSEDTTAKTIIKKYLEYLEKKHGLAGYEVKMNLENEATDNVDELWNLLQTNFFSPAKLQTQPWYKKIISVSKSPMTSFSLFSIAQQSAKDNKNEFRTSCQSLA
ncbi:hypothetical protein [Legionella clemsonensis]|uniref:Uncharacterized protein n=1 Tax=Legionella clemsonensis TaxID=1867846 RepID=A0A222P2X6_9GAMM|nr:hypothetical protein [Legionella clemsonensis]ASQ46193.1 hypothetical protein clem_08205 [Legionella clemsonensis]